MVILLFVIIAKYIQADEFNQRIQICLRESKETHYWYRIINKLEIGDRNLCKILLPESIEIMLIFGSISSKIKNKIKDQESNNI